MASSDFSSGSDSKVRRIQRRKRTSDTPQPLSGGNLPPKHPSNQRESRCSPSRLQMVWMVLLSGLLGLSINLFRLQISLGPTLKQQAEYQQSQRSLPFIPRRPISDVNGNIIAIDQVVYSLYVHPVLFKEPASDIADKLAAVLIREDLSRPTSDELLEKFEAAQSGIKLEESLSEEVGDKIAKLRIDGFELIQARKRLYPQQGIAADIVGYVDLEGKGQAGVEHSQQDLLERVMPSVKLQRGADGTWVPSQLASGFVQLDDLELRLTIDTRLQRIARSALEEQVKKHRAKRGTVIVMDAKDGSLLALVNEPSYNPNEYWKSNVELFKNWALSDLYEPGSTFKPINVALALEAGAIEPDTVIYDEGRIKMGRWTIQNVDYNSVGAYGSLSITSILKYSSNIGMVRIMQRMDPEVYYKGLKRLGLGDVMQVDLPFEIESNIKTRNQFVNVPVEVATASFGQGLSITPLKLAQLNAILANGGQLVTPHVVQGLYNSKGQLYWELNLPEPRQVLSSKTAKTVLEMMESVVSDGTGKKAKIDGYRIAGKTGTAQKAAASGGYSKSARITNFVGILSIDYPRYVVVAVIDEPDGGSGGTVAAPVVKTVMEGVIGLQKIPPSNPNFQAEQESESE